MNQSPTRIPPASDRDRRVRRTACALSLLLGAAAAPAQAAGPVTIRVTTTADATADDDVCSLREAIARANLGLSQNEGEALGCIRTASAVNTIIFAPAVTGRILLQGSLPAITAPLTITGPGADVLAISGNDRWRILSASAATTISGLTLKRGNARTQNGGAIASSARLTLDRVTLANNSAAAGGAVSMVSPGKIALTIKGSTLSGNSATGSGGALHLTSAGEDAGKVVVSNSTFYANSAGYSAGAIFVDHTDITIRNSTLAFSNSPLATGGAVVQGTNAPIGVMHNTIVVQDGGQASGLEACNGMGGANFTGSANFIVNPDDDDLTCGSALAWASPDDMKLGALGDYGGPTPTMPLRLGSVAIGAGNPTVCARAPVNGIDQRGRTRPANCDVGAFERGEPAP